MHFLKKNIGCETPSNLIFMDTETDEREISKGKAWLHTFKIGAAIYLELRSGKATRERRIVTDKLDELHEFIYNSTRDKAKLYVYAHNFQFDFPVMRGFDFLDKYGFKIEKMIIDSQRFILHARKGKRSIVFLDTYNYFKTSIADMGIHVGKSKLPIDFKNCSVEELKEYCMRDVEILRDFMISFINWWRSNNYGCWGYSASSLSMNTFRHRFMDDKIYVHNIPEVDKFEKESYRGGRNECFKIGFFHGEIFCKLDVNSMYPYVMYVNQYPTKLVDVIENVSVDDLKDLVKKFLVIADVEFETDEPCIGVKKGKLIFPTGYLRAVLTTPEIQHLLERHVIHKVHKVLLYNSSFIFRRFVEHFYNLRLEYKKKGNKLYADFSKLVLNSLYGKFGQHTNTFKLMGEAAGLENGVYELVDLRNKTRKTVYVLNNCMYEVVKNMPTSHTFTAVSSHVTAYARMMMWKLITTAGVENMYYCDTDSLIVNDTGYSNLKDYIDNSRLGYLKLEDTASEIIVLAPKFYVFGGKVKRKGITEKAEILSENEFNDYRWYKIRGLLRKNIFDGVLVEKYVKKVRLEYDKGVVDDKGNVKPFYFPPSSS